MPREEKLTPLLLYSYIRRPLCSQLLPFGQNADTQLSAARTLRYSLFVSIPYRKGGRMDALELLKKDHETVKELFEEAEGTEDKKVKEELFEDIKTELETHARIEETVFYPAMEKHAELKDMVLESIDEHKQVKTLLREIDNLKSDSEQFEPKLKVLMEKVEHHAEDEEEGKMFLKVRELLSEKDLEQLGQDLEAAK
jgi:hemerythrin superfamily protein